MNLFQNLDKWNVIMAIVSVILVVCVVVMSVRRRKAHENRIRGEEIRRILREGELFNALEEEFLSRNFPSKQTMRAGYGRGQAWDFIARSDKEYENFSPETEFSVYLEREFYSFEISNEKIRDRFHFALIQAIHSHGMEDHGRLNISGVALDEVDSFVYGDLKGAKALARLLAERLFIYESVCRNVQDLEKPVSTLESQLNSSLSAGAQQVFQLAQRFSKIVPTPQTS